MKKAKLITIILIVILSIGLDQVSKKIVRNTIAYHENIEVAGKYFTLTKVENTGAFLSLGNELPKFFYYLLMVVLPILVIGYAVHYLLSKKEVSKALEIGISLVVGGGLGNIIDRILYGSVTDFMYMDFIIFHTGVFNIADMCVMAAMGFLLFDMYIRNKEGKQEI